MDTPQILYFDIETSITIFAGFQLGKQHISHEQVLKRPQVMCISWAWNDKKVEHDTFDLKKYDLLKKDDDADFGLLERFSKLLLRADLVVGQNSIAFDLPTLTSRIIKYKLPPLPDILHDDIYLKTKKTVKHLSHKLDDVGDFLGYGGKREHGHGMEWWIKIAQGNGSVLREMVKYCDDDVVKLRKIYKHTLPYIKSSLNRAAFSNQIVCRNCGSKNLNSRGFRLTTAQKFQRYQCQDCGSWTSSGIGDIKKPGRLPR